MDAAIVVLLLVVNVALVAYAWLIADAVERLRDRVAALENRDRMRERVSRYA